MTADWITTVSTAAGSAWLSGINLYATVVTLGLLQRYQLVKLPGELGILGNWWVIGLAAGLYLVEFIADKIPAVDSVWDALHTFIRVPAGAILAATAFADQRSASRRSGCNTCPDSYARAKAIIAWPLPASAASVSALRARAASPESRAWTPAR